MLSSLVNWTVKRRRLLAGVAGAAIETTAAFVPGVGVAAKLIGALIEKGTEEALAPEEKPTAEQLTSINDWLAKLSGCYGELLAQLEKLPDAASQEEANRRVREALRHNDQLAKLFDDHLMEVRQMTLSLGVIEHKLDEHFHVQQKVHASMEELKEVFVHSPLMRDYHEFKKARPDDVRLLNEASDHFLAGRRDEGARLLLGLLKGHGVGERTIVHALGLAEFGQGRVQQAAAHLTQTGGSGSLTVTRLSMTGGRVGVPVWRSLPRGLIINEKYRIEDEVGRGGMASVYRAVKTEDFDDVPVVALKVPALSDDPTFAERFKKEIVRTKRLRHDNIVSVEGYEIFREPHSGQRSYAMVMEYVPGKSLSRYLERRKANDKPLSIDEVRTVMLAVCNALEYAHAHNILHRDVKPHNVLVTAKMIKLMDFGIAREMDAHGGVTRPGAIEGTLAYMPPEMLHPDASNPPGAAADIYMCGVLLRELLTFQPNGKLERTDLPAGWRELIRDARQSDSADRPESIAAFRQRLQVTKPVAARSASEETQKQPATVVVPPAPVVPAKKEPERTFTNSIGMQFVLVEPGTFLMGSPANEANRRNNEQQHEVTLTKAFYMAIHPVTQGQWVKVMGSNPSYFSRTGGGKDRVREISDADLAMFPVECVSWEDAQTFLNALATLNEEAKFGRKYRLPTEAEWEYACRDGGLGVARNNSHLPFHFAQPTSSLSSTQANFGGSLQRTSKIGSYPANALGIFDMHGNVWEWCADWYGEYATAPCTDPTGPSHGSRRVGRGGGWYGSAGYCRAAYRCGLVPGSRDCFLGLRLARVPSSS